MDLIITALPVVTKDLPISPPRFTPYNFLSRCKFSTLTTCQPMVEFYLLTFPRFPSRKKEHKSYFGKNRTHDFRTSRCAGYLLLIDHSGVQYQYVAALARYSSCPAVCACLFFLICWFSVGGTSTVRPRESDATAVFTSKTWFPAACRFFAVVYEHSSILNFHPFATTHKRDLPYDRHIACKIAIISEGRGVVVK